MTRPMPTAIHVRAPRSYLSITPAFWRSIQSLRLKMCFGKPTKLSWANYADVSAVVDLPLTQPHAARGADKAGDGNAIGKVSTASSLRTDMSRILGQMRPARTAKLRRRQLLFCGMASGFDDADDRSTNVERYLVDGAMVTKHFSRRRKYSGGITVTVYQTDCRFRERGSAQLRE
jgi:hypothetical protein